MIELSYFRATCLLGMFFVATTSCAVKVTTDDHDPAHAGSHAGVFGLAGNGGVVARSAGGTTVVAAGGIVGVAGCGASAGVCVHYASGGAGGVAVGTGGNPPSGVAGCGYTAGACAWSNNGGRGSFSGNAGVGNPYAGAANMAGNDNVGSAGTSGLGGIGGASGGSSGAGAAGWNCDWQASSANSFAGTTNGLGFAGAAGDSFCAGICAQQARTAPACYSSTCMTQCWYEWYRMRRLMTNPPSAKQLLCYTHADWSCSMSSAPIEPAVCAHADQCP